LFFEMPSRTPLFFEMPWRIGKNTWRHRHSLDAPRLEVRKLIRESLNMAVKDGNVSR